MVHFHVALGNVLLFCGFHLYGIKSTLKTSHSVANPFYWKQCWPFEMTHFCGKAGSFRSLPLEGSLVPQTSCSLQVQDFALLQLTTETLALPLLLSEPGFYGIASLLRRYQVNPFPPHMAIIRLLLLMHVCLGVFWLDASKKHKPKHERNAQSDLLLIKI